MDLSLIFITIIGLLIGSFLNVCIWRIPRHISVARPHRSMCPKCKTTLKGIENIPVISWLFLRGKCSHCKESISGRYPLVEILSAIGASMSYIYFGGITPTSVIIYVITATLIVITFIDFDFQIIPDVISIPGIILGYILSITATYSSIFKVPTSIYSTPLYKDVLTSGVIDSLIGSLLGAGFFLAILWGYYFISGKIGLGLGDVKLMAFFGAFFGYKCLMPIIFMASILGSIIGIILILITKKGRHTEIAFGPWLACGAIIYIFTDLDVFNLISI